MAKTMAKIENGVVVNMLWCSDKAEKTDTLVDIADRPVSIGDTFSDGKFFRGDEEVLTPLEEAHKLLAEYEQALSEIEAALGVSG